ncbi:MAG: RNA polymerase sigma factor [Pedobacter sp.]|nr:MAG: RNA polymerase sigma factor [Pedobacter sp.]
MNTTDNREAFLQLIEQNKGIIIKICNSYCREKDDRQDLAQEIIYQLWKSYPSFDHRSGIHTWIYRVALNVAIYQLKLTKRRVSTQPIEEQLLNVQDTIANVT